MKVHCAALDLSRDVSFCFTGEDCDSFMIPCVLTSCFSWIGWSQRWIEMRLLEVVVVLWMGMTGEERKRKGLGDDGFV